MTERLFRFWAVGGGGLRRRALVVAAGCLAALAVPRQAEAQEEALVIRRLAFEGNHLVETVALEAAIATTNSSWLARNLTFLGLGELRRLNEREFRRDVARIKLYYQLRGFLDARIDTSVVRTNHDAYITFRITEGAPVRIRSFAIRGLDSLPERDRLVRDLPLRTGMIFNRYLIGPTADTIQLRLFDRGYPTATVLVGRREVDSAARTADLELVADPGRPATIGPIRIAGTNAVDSAHVRALLTTRTGRPFSYSALYQSQITLYQSGLFRLATVGMDTTRFTVGDPAVPLLVQVQEGPLYRARAGIGVGTNDCVRANAGWTARNVGRRGRQVDFDGSISKLGVETDPLSSTICNGLREDTVGSRKINYSLSASLRRPVFLSPSNSLTGTVFAERRSEFLVYLREDIGSSVTFTREAWRGLPFSLSYRVSYGSTQASAVSFCGFFLACRAEDIEQLRARRISASLTANVSRQRVNNPVDPTRGSVYRLEGTFSSPLIGSSRFSEFTRLVGEGSWYKPLGNSGVVIAAHLRGGITFSPRLQLRAGATNFVPPDQRFYAGGANDIRGYDRNELGPVIYVTPTSNLDSTDALVSDDEVRVAPIGGNTTAVANLELRLPSPVLPGRVRWAAFVDAGSVWERGGASPLLAITPGLGFRFGTPLGPMRFDVAYRARPWPAGALYVADGDSLRLLQSGYVKPLARHFNIQFSVGQAF